MKKFALMLALALPVVMASCSNDDEPEVETKLTFEETSVDVVYGSTYAIKGDLVTSSKDEIVWTSSNTFVATVDDEGVITAKHIGEAVITGTIDNVSATCKVTVTPLYTNFVFPCLQWGANQATVKAAVKGFELDQANSDATKLSYWTNVAQATFPAYQYRFNSTGALYTAALIVAEDQLTVVNNWLLQYYENVTSENTEAIAAYKYGDQYLELDFLGDNLDAVITTWVAPATAAAPAVRSGNVIADAKADAAEMIKNRK